MNIKPKVLFLVHLPPPWHGSSIIGKTIYENRLINDSFHCYYINLLASQTIKETGKIRLKKIAKFIVLFIKLLIVLIKRRPHLCYFALTIKGAAFFKDFLLIVLIRIFKIKIIYHLHNKGIIYQKSKLLNLFYKFIFKGSEVILLSHYLYPEVSRYIQESNVHICPNGLEIIKTDHSILNNNPVPKIIFLSNLIQSKGILILLKACSILKTKGIAFKCWYIGEEGDWTASRLNESINKLNLLEQVTYLGKKYGEEKERILNEADIFAFPSYYPMESFPLVNLEAMQHSLPVVSTFEGGIPDIVEDGVTGFLIPQQNAEALAEKLELLIKDPDLRKRMGEAGKNKFLQKFTLEIFQKRITNILEKIVEQ